MYLKFQKMGILKIFIPKTFLKRWSLESGVVFVCVVYAIVLLVCSIIAIVHLSNLNTYLAQNSAYIIRNSYGITVVNTVYHILLFILCFLLFLGVYKKHRSVVLAWLVLTAIWLAQTLVLLIVLIYIYSRDVSFVAWLLSLIFGIIAILLLSYGLLVVLSFWLELKGNKEPTT